MVLMNVTVLVERAAQLRRTAHCIVIVLVLF